MKQVKGLLLLSAAVIVLRIILEETGIAVGLHNVLGVTWLILIVPIYLGWTIGRSASDSPVKQAAVAAVVFAVATRFMVMVTYSLAWIFGFGAARFSVAGGAVVGEGVTALQGMLLIPGQIFLISSVAFAIVTALLAAATAWFAGRGASASGVQMT